MRKRRGNEREMNSEIKYKGSQSGRERNLLLNAFLGFSVPM
jgi:hypothetical protein